jgi:Arc/MetJ-type ribon-helix-helix transcriptional regulator
LRKPTSIALSEEMVREIDKLELSKNISRSGVVRIAVSEFLEKGKSEKVENQNEKGEK